MTAATTTILGDLSQTMISGAFCMFFNKQLFSEYLPDAPSLYDTVLAGEWTLDKMIEYCSSVYAYVNGNSMVDEGDPLRSLFHRHQNARRRFVQRSERHKSDREKILTAAIHITDSPNGRIHLSRKCTVCCLKTTTPAGCPTTTETIMTTMIMTRRYSRPGC